MSKFEIVKDHILTAAKGLTTDDLKDVVKQLGKLEKQKIKEVLGSIPASEIDELYLMYESLCDSQLEVHLKREVSVRVNICTDNVEEGATVPYLLANLKHRSGYYDSAAEADELWTTEDLLRIPEIQDKYEIGKHALAAFNQKLKALAEKYKVSTELLLEHILDASV
jgi:hypothetical protein